MRNNFETEAVFNHLEVDVEKRIFKMDQSNILSNDWKELIIEDSETKQKLVIINNEGVEITSSKINVRLIPKR